MNESIGQSSPVGFSRRFRARVLAGLVLIIPIWITYIVVTFVFRIMRDASLWLVEAVLLGPFGESVISRLAINPNALNVDGLSALPLVLQWGISTVAVFLTVAALYIFGAIATNVAGKRMLRLGESVVERVPIVPVIYHASKKVLETLVGDSSRPFQRVVLAPFPTKETASVGFVTRETKDATTGAVLLTVFVPTAPNPTTGFVFVIKPSDVVDVDWSAEEAIKIIMSGGVLMPASIPMSQPAKDVGPQY
ncbi:MAG: DUF502 domain-containing protein [Planctomycetales bacterium]|nr:DUF502 domain-containing protein [Planctomycetales bacterium]